MRLVARCWLQGRFTTPDGGVVHRLSPGDEFVTRDEDGQRLVRRRAADGVKPAVKAKSRKPAKAKKASKAKSKAKPKKEG